MLLAEFNLCFAQSACRNAFHNLKKVAFKQRKHNLSFGVAETAVIFDNLRAVLCYHKSEIQAALKSSALGVHGVNCRQEYLFHASFGNLGGVIGVGSNRSHAARVETLVIIVRSLVIH